MSQHDQQQQDDPYGYAQFNSEYQAPYSNSNNTTSQIPLPGPHFPHLSHHVHEQSSRCAHDHSSNIPNNFTRGASPQSYPYAHLSPAQPYAQASPAHSYTQASPARHPSPSQYPISQSCSQGHTQTTGNSAIQQAPHWVYHPPSASPYPPGALPLSPTNVHNTNTNQQQVTPGLQLRSTHKDRQQSSPSTMCIHLNLMRFLS
ncbi:hypothetical protein SNOG_00054 [Parastagonospora nodorum SN15]|uniref:Uncharacterized protein n=1 Tax=Phaeosphaeria nodorum (strain SN15 / ATCC MYA-4574 / FGSC 10173) TaxID=321614 RepID=Q0V7G0_PHANO|nr:hypothetical protein SNOG_00054 [Parastagonospora nodorum SN15]EAT91549.1 hypothetical protein SNOG_00054 [Parastagonospora nodorum SN15]